MKKRITEKHYLDWNGHLLEITYEPLWLPAHAIGEDLAYIHVKSIYPTLAPLPIAQNGVYAHYLAPSIVTAAGGPVNYVDVMLAAENDPR